ncbi:hypothetical protein AZL_003800 [Azospirillum sp. B510]|uniref:hypothetical protein n=2 Tax=Alphaproteobacteria TaxID=28211 RepID=UPI0001C4C4B0|nr:hypothetical protein [Azospirillum sp. B510]BAI71018.1 hypothetical protein AZL_003800 [Azospirillum sp. B510]
MANSGAFTRVKEWNDVNSGLRLANAGGFVDKIRKAMTDLDESTANDFMRVLQIPRSGMTMPGTKDHRDRARAVLLIQLLLGETTTADAPTVRATLLSKSDGDLDGLIRGKAAAVGRAAPPSVQPELSLALVQPPSPPPSRIMTVAPPARPAPLFRFRQAATKVRADIHEKNAPLRQARSLADGEKSALKTKLDNFLTTGDLLDVQGSLFLLQGHIQAMLEGVEAAYGEFEKAMIKDGEAEKAKVGLALSIVRSGLILAGGPLADVAVRLIGHIVEVSAQTAKDALKSGIEATVTTGLFEYSKAPDSSWAEASRVVSPPTLNQSIIHRAARSFRRNVADRAMNITGVPGKAQIKVTIMNRFGDMILEMTQHLKHALFDTIMTVKDRSGSTVPRLAVLAGNLGHRTLEGTMDRNVYAIVDIFIEHVTSTAPQLLLLHGAHRGIDTYLDELRRTVKTEWVSTFNVPASSVTPGDAKAFAELCEIKMWCRVIANERLSGRNRKPKDACVQRLDATGLIKIWKQSVKGSMGFSSADDARVRQQIYTAGKLRYHGSTWEVEALVKLAEWIDDDENVNIAKIGIGMMTLRDVQQKIRKYARDLTYARDKDNRDLRLSAP